MGVRDTRRTRVVLFVLLVVALGLIAFGYSDGSSPLLRGVRHVSGSVFGGIEHAASSVAGFFGGSGSSGAQVRQLQQEVTTLRAELSGAQLTKADYQQLRKLLLVAGAGQYRIVAASVVAVGQGYQLSVTLDAGSASGVKTGDTVMNDLGLVGQVTTVTSSTSTVVLASNASPAIGVEVAPSGQLGYVTGPGPVDGGDGLMQLNMLNSSSVIHVGEQLVTAPSTSSQDLVPGVPVGTITKVLIRNGSLTSVAEVKPFTNFTSLGIVGVIIQEPAHNPRFAVLPPQPPTATVTVTVTPRATRPRTSPSPTPAAGG
jgi:rod shape-determining protein MreC